MSADAKKTGMFADLSKLEIWLEIFVPLLVMLAFLSWVDEQSPLERRIFSDGTVEVRENMLVLLAAMMLSLSMAIFGVAVLWRRRWRRLALAGLISLLMGVAPGLIFSRMALSGVLMFTPTGMTASAPAWQGGETRAKLIYSQIDWLGTRERIRWERDWNPRSYVIKWMAGTKPGWRRIEVDECLVKLKGGDETQVDMGWTVKGAWDEILKAARSAGVTVKPTERIILSKPTD